VPVCVLEGTALLYVDLLNPGFKVIGDPVLVKVLPRNPVGVTENDVLSPKPIEDTLRLDETSSRVHLLLFPTAVVLMPFAMTSVIEVLATTLTSPTPAEGINVRYPVKVILEMQKVQNGPGLSGASAILIP
jgi:hypothetical protein